jgi:hypothetical protein
MHAISCGRKVAEDDRRVRSARNANGRREGATDDQDADRRYLVVGNIEDGFRGVAIDQLHAEDLGLREGGTDVDGEGGSLTFVLRVGGDLFWELLNVLDLMQINVNPDWL